MQAEAPDPVVRLDVLRQRPQNHHNDDHDRDDTLHHSGATTAHSIIHSQETRGGDNNMVVNESTRKKGSDSEKDVNIVIKSSPVRFIMFIDVVYGEKASDAPQGCVRTFNGNNDDINAKFGGKFVWMVPRCPTDITKAATSFAIFIHTDPVHQENPPWLIRPKIVLCPPPFVLIVLFAAKAYYVGATVIKFILSLLLVRNT